MRFLRFLAATIAVGLSLSAPVCAQAPTPAQLQSRINAVPWANGQKLVTGSTLQGLFNYQQSIFPGMGTWDANGVYTPTIGGLPPAVVATSGKFTDLINLPTFAGDQSCSYASGAYTCTVSKINGQTPANVALSGSANDVSVPAFQSAPTNLVSWLQGICATWDGAGCHPVNAINSTTPFAATGSSGTRSAADRFANAVYSDADASVKCDSTQGSTGSGTDNTSALLSAIGSGQTVISQGDGRRIQVQPCLAGKQIRAGDLSVTGQAFIEGAANFSSLLTHATGSNNAALTITPQAAYNFGADGHPQGQMEISRLRITSEDSASAYSTYPNSNGLSFTRAGTNPLGLWARVKDLVIYNVPGSGVSAFNFPGFVHFERLYVKNAGGNCISSNSDNDFRYDQMDLSGCGGDGFNSAGDAQAEQFNPNIYTVGGNADNLQNSGLKAIGGVKNLNGKSGTLINNPAAQNVFLFGTSYGSNGSAATGSYADVDATASNRVIHGLGLQFYSPPGRNLTYNIRLGTGAYMLCDYCFFAASLGNNLSNITNAQAQLDMMDDVSGVRVFWARGITLKTAGPYQGLDLQTPTGNHLLLCQGNTANNDGGFCQWYNGATVTAQVSAYAFAPTYFDQDVYLGNGSTNATPNSRNLRATGGSGTDKAGAKLGLYGGAGTGAGAGGDIAIGACPPGTTGSAANVCVDSFKVNGTTGLPQVLRATPVSGLPTCNATNLGSVALVTDATAPTYGGALVGGSNVQVPAWCTASGATPTYAWTAH